MDLNIQNSLKDWYEFLSEEHAFFLYNVHSPGMQSKNMQVSEMEEKIIGKVG